MYSGGTIRRKLDFQTRVRILASTSILLETSATKKKRNHGRCEWTIIEILVTGYNEGIMHTYWLQGTVSETSGVTKVVLNGR